MPATATLEGVVFLLGGVAVESSHTSAHHSGVKTQILLRWIE
jgi:hypothetical protein